MIELFEQVHWLLQQAELKRNESLKRGERFNMFGVCGVNHYENTHSGILSEMLNPQGSHGQGNLFLTLFLKELSIESLLDDNHADVLTEYSTDYGRIDILIKDTEGHAIIIENKIYAADQNEQLKRYNNYALSKYGQGNYMVLYLTLNGEDASEDSAGTVEYTRVSYARNVLSWLNDCIEKSAALPLIRETLIQYRNHIKQLTNQDMESNEKQELLRLMATHPKEVDTLMTAQADYGEYVFDTYVWPELQDYARTKGIICEKYNLFGSGKERGIYFRREQWKSMAIFLFNDHAGEWDFYWGISDFVPCDMSQLPKMRIDCFNGGPVDHWPYGWKYLDQYRDWDFASGTFTAMIEGDFVKYVTGQVDIILDEIESKNIMML